MMTESKCEPEQFKGRIIFMSMCHDIDWRKRGNREDCLGNALRVADYARKFTRGHLSEHKSANLMENVIKTAEDMMLNFAESGHPIFRASSALQRGEMKREGKGVKSIHSLQRW